MSVVPRVNSLIGIPNPIAATPAAATAMPNNDKITDMFASAPRLLAAAMVLWLAKNLIPFRSKPQELIWRHSRQTRS